MEICSEVENVGLLEGVEKSIPGEGREVGTEEKLREIFDGDLSCDDREGMK
jgi:hypothetical protein